MCVWASQQLVSLSLSHSRSRSRGRGLIYLVPHFVYAFVLILFSPTAECRVVSGECQEKCNRRNAAWHIWTSSKGSLINWLSWTRRTRNCQACQAMPSGVRAALSSLNKLKFSKLSNDTFTYKTRPKKAWLLTHVTKIYKTLTLIACGVVFWLWSTVKEKKTHTRTHIHEINNIKKAGELSKRALGVTGTVAWERSLEDTGWPVIWRTKESVDELGKREIDVKKI